MLHTKRKLIKWKTIYSCNFFWDIYSWNFNANNNLFFYLLSLEMFVLNTTHTLYKKKKTKLLINQMYQVWTNNKKKHIIDTESNIENFVSIWNKWEMDFATKIFCLRLSKFDKELNIADFTTEIVQLRMSHRKFGRKKSEAKFDMKYFVSKSQKNCNIIIYWF